MAILISGIGRSGTTTLYQILGKGLISKYGDARCVYEPYLWSMPEIEETAIVKGQPFSVGQVGLFNLYVHCNTPLFLKQNTMLHNAWLERVFRPVSRRSRNAPDNILAKVIRGSGRLEAILERFDNLKIIVVTRNVVDTINSGLGLFSFYGDEFHPSDKPRFIEEVNRLYGVGLRASDIENEIQWSALWWHYFTEASIATAERYPDRVMLVPYEIYTKNKINKMKELFDFAGIEHEHLDTKLFNQDAGPRTSVSYLDQRDINQLNDELSWYFVRLKDLGIDLGNSNVFRNELVSSYGKKERQHSLLLKEKTDLTAVQWRIKFKEYLNKNKTEANFKHTPPQAAPLTIGYALSEFDEKINRAPLQAVRSSMQNKARNKGTLGVLITCFNNRKTITEAIYSVLSQSKKPDLVIVADDCSSDDSIGVVERIAKKFKILKIISRPENIGVAANRDLAIREFDTDYVATLDGDDIYFPGKLELEYAALGGDLEKVAFSDIGLVTNEACVIQKTNAYHAQTREIALALLTGRSAPVPRDLMFSRKMFENAEGFDVGMNLYEDWSFKMRLFAAAPDCKLVHTGGLGTIYDRRNPGLSNKAPLLHAYFQLLALSRNVESLRAYPNVLIAGLRTVSKHLNGNLRVRFEALVQSAEKDISEVLHRLPEIWESASFDERVETKSESMWKFSQ